LIWGSEIGEPFLPEVLPSIYGADFACEKSENNIYKTDKGKSNYVWEVTGGAIAGASNADSVVVSWTQVTQGKVTVRYTDSGIPSATASLTVEVRQRPNPQITGDRYILYNTENHLYTTESGKENYSWTFSGNIVLSEGGGNDDHTAWIDAGDVGTATISVNYLQDGCAALTPTVFQIDIVTDVGIDDNPYENSVIIAPNPSYHHTTVAFEKPFSGVIYLYNVLGILLQKIPSQSVLNQNIDLSNYPNGLYILELTTENELQIHRKIIKY